MIWFQISAFSQYKDLVIDSWLWSFGYYDPLRHCDYSIISNHPAAIFQMKSAMVSRFVIQFSSVGVSTIFPSSIINHRVGTIANFKFEFSFLNINFPHQCHLLESECTFNVSTCLWFTTNNHWYFPFYFQVFCTIFVLYFSCWESNCEPKMSATHRK